MFETNHSYKVIEVIGTSDASWEEAAQHLQDLRVAEVISHDAKIEGGKIVSFRTKLRLSFRYHVKGGD